MCLIIVNIKFQKLLKGMSEEILLKRKAGMIHQSSDTSSDTKRKSDIS